jgi:ABC-type multidrug transport system fused ATPase/permease subunit
VLLLANIDLQHVTFGYDNQLQPLFKDVSLSLDEHWCTVTLDVSQLARKIKKISCKL